MTLKEYLKKNKISVQEFSAQIGVSWGSLYRNIRGRRMNPERALLIEKITKGEVSKEELMYLK